VKQRNGSFLASNLASSSALPGQFATFTWLEFKDYGRLVLDMERTLRVSKLFLYRLPLKEVLGYKLKLTTVIFASIQDFPLKSDNPPAQKTSGAIL